MYKALPMYTNVLFFFLGFPLSWSYDYNWKSYQARKYGLGLHKSDLVGSDYGQFYHWSLYPYGGPLYPRYPASKTMKFNDNELDYHFYRDRDKYGHSGLIEDGHKKATSKWNPTGAKLKSYKKEDLRIKALPTIRNDRKGQDKPKVRIKNIKNKDLHLPEITDANLHLLNKDHTE